MAKKTKTEVNIATWEHAAGAPDTQDFTLENGDFVIVKKTGKSYKVIKAITSEGASVTANYSNVKINVNTD